MKLKTLRFTFVLLYEASYSRRQLYVPSWLLYVIAFREQEY